MTSRDLIAMSIRESRTIVEYPTTRADAATLLADLAVECDIECCPLDHHSGAGYSGQESVGYYDIWGTSEDGGEWRVRLVSHAAAVLGPTRLSNAPEHDRRS